MSKIEGRYNTKYPNLTAFHSSLYKMRASSMLRKAHPNEKKHFFRFKVTTKFQYILYIISLHIPTFLSLYNQKYSLHKSYIFSGTIYICRFQPFDEPRRGSPKTIQIVV